MPDALSQVLSRMSNDYRSTVAFYGNIQGRPGIRRAPRRLLNDTGFLETTDFTYLVPSPSHVEVGSDPRANTSIVFHPYGLREDVQRLISDDPVDRRVRSSDHMGFGQPGVVGYPGASDWITTADQSLSTVSLQRTINLVRRVTNAHQGPAYHFIVNRAGDIVVTAALDDIVRAFQSSATSIDVAVETALAIPRQAWQDKNFDSILELPFTEVQLTTLSILVAKLLTAYPAITRDETGLVYAWPPDYPQTTVANFQTTPQDASAVPFDYSQATREAFFLRVDTQGTFDLATEVYRPVQTAPTPIATRTEARTSIATADTAGALSVRLGNYAGIAAAERSNEMQSNVRQRFFVQRVNTSNADGDASAAAAAHVQASIPTLSHAPAAVTNYAQLAYNYATGLWGDEQSY